jgi:hypothetical protein
MAVSRMNINSLQAIEGSHEPVTPDLHRKTISPADSFVRAAALEMVLSVAI